jgi:hypothetical protein
MSSEEFGASQFLQQCIAGRPYYDHPAVLIETPHRAGRGGDVVVV